MRFVGQGYELNVPLPSGDYRVEDLDTLRHAFLEVYAATYGDQALTATIRSKWSTGG